MAEWVKGTLSIPLSLCLDLAGLAVVMHMGILKGRMADNVHQRRSHAWLLSTAIAEQLQ